LDAKEQHTKDSKKRVEELKLSLMGRKSSECLLYTSDNCAQTIEKAAGCSMVFISRSSMQGAASAKQRQPMRCRYRVCLVDLIRHVMRVQKFACSHFYAKRCTMNPGVFPPTLTVCFGVSSSASKSLHLPHRRHSPAIEGKQDRDCGKSLNYAGHEMKVRFLDSDLAESGGYSESSDFDGEVQ
jgi:hypothetical protein